MSELKQTGDYYVMENNKIKEKIEELVESLNRASKA